MIGYAEADLGAYYRSVIEVMTEGIAILRSDGTIADANTSAARLVGVPRAAVLGHRLLDLRWKTVDEAGHLISHRDHPALVTMRTGLALHNVVMGLSRVDGSTVWLSVNTNPMFRPGEIDPYAVVASFTDITHERLAAQALLESEARFRRLSDASMDGIMITTEGIITEVNRAASQIFGYREQELIGMRSLDLVAPETQASAEMRIRENLEGSYHTLGLHKDKITRIPLHVIANVVHSEGRSLRVTVIRDMRATDTLDRMQREFVSTVSHELRTPLTSIRGALGLLHGGAAGELSTKGRDLVRVALSNAERLMALINDLLDLEHIELGKLVLQLAQTNPRDIVQQAVLKSRQTADVRRIEIQTDIDLQPTAAIYADSERLVQVLVNLLSNAIKFSREGTCVVVSVSEAGSGIRFAVTDYGTGIEPFMFDRLFKKFTQGDSSDVRQKGGAGLGLPIAQAIVKQHGGSITAESELQQHTTFWFTIPKIPLPLSEAS